MTDNLRTRIAAAIMDACHGVYLDDAVDAADVVIRDLNLKIVVEYPSVDGARHNYMVAGHYTEDVNDAR